MQAFVKRKKWCLKISLVLGWSVRFMSFAYTCNGFIERYIWALACDATRNALKHRIRMLFYCVLINSNAQALVLLLETSYSSVCSLTLDSEWTPKYKTNSNFRLNYRSVCCIACSCALYWHIQRRENNVFLGSFVHLISLVIPLMFHGSDFKCCQFCLLLIFLGNAVTLQNAPDNGVQILAK